MADLNKLREERAELAKELVQLRDKSNDTAQDWTSEDEGKWTEINKRYDDTTARIERADRVAEVEKHQNERAEEIELEQRNYNPAEQEQPGKPTPITAELRDIALAGWCARQAQKKGADVEVTDEQRGAAKTCGVNLEAGAFDIKLSRNYRDVKRQFRAQSVGTDSEGGYTSPDGFVARVETAMLEYGGVRSVADVLRTSKGDTIEWPTVNDTGNTGSTIAENAAAGETDAVFGVFSLDAYKRTSDMVRVSSELLQDSEINVPGLLADLLGERLGRRANADFTTGDGSGDPNGIVTASTLGKTAAGAAAITADELIDLYHSVDPAYRRNAGWMLKDSTIQLIRKLKDGDSQYVWQPGLQAGVPDRLLGHAVTVNQDMPAATTGLKSVLFGDFSKYKVREVGSIRLLTSSERYLENDQTAFVAFMRWDGDLLNAGTNPVKHLIQA